MEISPIKENPAELLRDIQVWSDKPIPSAFFFNFQEYSKALATIIQRKDTDTPLTIGIFGDWGSGKTSLMKTIESRLNGLYFSDEFENFEDFVDNLAVKLKYPDTTHLISRYCKKQFSQKGKKLLSETNIINISGPFRIAFVEELNKLITRPQFFNKQAFAEVNLTDKTKKLLLKQPLTYEEMINLNRSLLNDAYEIEKDLKEKDTNSYPVKTIWFNAWKYDKEEALWRALLMRILEEMKIPEKQAVQDNSKNKLAWLAEKIASFSQRLRNNWHFNIDDIKDLDQLLFTIIYANNPLSTFLMEKLSPDLKHLLQEYVLIDQFDTRKATFTLKATLIDELNQLIVKDPSVKGKIDHLHLKNTARELLQQDPQGNKLTQLNWMILKQALFSDVVNKEIDDFNKDIECLQTSLYQDVYREELGGIEIEPTKAIKGTIKLGLSAIPAIGKPVSDILKEIDNESAFNELLESVQRKKKVDFIERVQFMEQFQHKFEMIVENYHRNKRIVIFIDDLDRCLPEKAIEILESIKLFLDVQNCIIVLGIDERVISKSMEVKYKDFLIGENKEIPISGDNYLEKFIQLGFKLPIISDKNIEEYINNLKVPDFYAPFLEMIIKGVENNPRKIKRFFNIIELHRKLAYSLEEITEYLSELEKAKSISEKRFDALLVEWQKISQHHPKIRKVIENNPEILLILHEYLKSGERDKIKENLSNVSEELSEMVIKDTKLMDLIEIFPFDISEGDFIKDINQVILEKAQPIRESKDIRKRFDALLVEWQIISQHNPEIRKIIENNPEILSILHEFLKPEERDKIKENLSKVSKELSEIVIKDAELMDLIEIFPFDISRGDFIKDINQVIYLSSFTAAMTDQGEEESIEIKSMSRNEIENAIEEKKSLMGRNLKGADLKGLNLTGMNFNGADLTGAVITNAKLTRAVLKSANLTDTQLEDSDLRYTDFWYATLIRANLKNANLRDSILFNTDMEGADLSGAKLTNVGLMNANLKAVNFKGAILLNVNLKNTKFDKRTDFTGAEINLVTIDNLKESNWKDAKWDTYLREQIEKKYEMS
ncbi:MAG: pentapeptide repeat-containing protein [Methanococcoides sp.]|nr:pentapeptide repeat-containing protein [Methanococcoides sp.]